MPKSLDTVVNKVVSEKVWFSSKHKRQRVLKSKENIFKPKCNRELKKKLKKYKLRRDGIEDPDILDVSKTLVEFLRIKSPSNHEKTRVTDLPESEGVNPGNYLMRMVRRKKACHEVESSMINNSMEKNEETVVSILQDEVNDMKNMDAFKVMMDARNKSIGSNSPGKEKIKVPESQEIIDRKVNRAKRVLTLQKLALSKGSLKNKEIEEHRDACVQKKMVKRAQRLKDMIKGTESKVERKITNNCPDKVSVTNNNEISIKPTINNSFKLCNLFDNAMEVIEHANQCESLPIEDIEFLKKLSPSIRKKENMLSYFDKVCKDDLEYDRNNSSDKSNNMSIIKVKFNSKHKKKTKKITQASESLHVSSETVTVDVNTAISCNSSKPLNNYKRCKRKHLNVDEGTLEMSSLKTNDTVNPVSENRPKRNVKKPIKYSEDTQIFSSDEEFHIFTPKKKKNEKSLKSTAVEDKIKNKVNATDILELTSTDERRQVKCKKALVISKKIAVTNNSSKSKKQIDKKDVKLAPIFLAKMQISAADIEAKQNFLKSGVPEMLKKKVQKTTSGINFDIFQSIVHIQQNTFDANSYQYKTKDWCNVLNNDHFCGIHNNYSFKDLLTLENDDVITPVVKMLKPEQILKSMKNSYPKFPVYRTYNLLQGKSRGEFTDCSYQELDNSIEIVNGCIDTGNESPDQLNWCDKYKPTSSKQIIGNFESIKELKQWLETWTENLSKAKQLNSDSSDFSDFYISDTDSRDTVKNSNNVLILTGQTGSGKTSSVYAVASELAIKVIEVNASSKRTGKIMLQDLQEATQSHKVDRAKSGSESSQKYQEEIKSIKKKKCGRPKTVHNGEENKRVKPKKVNQKSSNMYQSQTLSQESGRTGMSLILVDDADIIFEQDDGFCSAISQLIQSSKRPVILITSALSCPHLQRFLHSGKVLHMQPYLPRMLGTWLDIMCLTDVGRCCKGLGAKILSFYKGDIRKTINCLQFYMSTLQHSNQDQLNHVKYNIEDETSSMSWAYLEYESSEMPISENTQTESILDKYMQVLHFNSAFNTFNVWWNLNNYYNNCYINIEKGINVHVKEKNTVDISKISHILDTLSMIDCFDHSHYGDTNITTTPWYKSETPSLSENENFDYYNKSSTIGKEINDILLVKTIALSQNKYENRLTFEPPSLSIQRNRDKLVGRHNKLSHYLNKSSVLDHRAIALDYWSACRSICRIEKNKTDSNIKRNNRFCHYLKSLNILCKNDFFDSLADSLS